MQRKQAVALLMFFYDNKLLLFSMHVGAKLVMTRLLQRVDLIMLLLFVTPIVASAIGGATLVRLAFPLGAFGVALWMAQGNPARYLRLLLWTLILVAGLRHFNDWYAGYSQANPMMLAPYLVVAAATPTVSLHVINGRRYAVEFLVLVMLVLCSLSYSLNTGDVMSGILTATRWLAGPWVALYICANASALPQLRHSVLRTFQLAIPIIALYGIDQFVDIKQWDAYFMKMAPINSIGFPVPFAVRVFATMNSPGSLAAMLGTGLLLLLPTTHGIRWAGILLGAATLLLTTQRAALGALVLAILIVAVAGRDGALRRGIFKMSIMVTVVVAVMLSIPGTAKKLMGTADSVSALNQDGSAQARLQQYHDVLPMLDENKFGRGLNWANNRMSVNIGDSVAVDSGFIDIFITLGLPGGLVFLAALTVLAFQALRIVLTSHDIAATAEFGGAIFGFAQLPFGSQHVAEHGIFLYLALGLLLARAIPTEVTRRRVTYPTEVGRR